MSQDPNTFRFPARPVRILVQDPVPAHGEEDDEKGEDGHGTLVLAPPWHQNAEEDPVWVYERDERTLFHRARGKKIALKDLNTAIKISRLITALEHREDMAVDSLIGALNVASLDCYQETLISVLSAHADGASMEWPGGNAEAMEPEREAPARRVDVGF